MEDANWSLIPEHCREGLRAYIEDGRDVGDFLYFVLSNDLFRAVGKADSVNLSRISDYVKFIYTYAPKNCHGSPENVRAWMRTGGLKGQSKAAANPELQVA